MAAAALLFGGCAGADTPDGQGTPKAKGTTSAGASPAAKAEAREKTLAQVRSDLRFAAAGFKELNFLEAPERPGSQVHAVAMSRTVPGDAELQRVISRFEERGWRVDGEVEAGAGAFLKAGDEWRVIAGVGPVPKEARAKAGSYRGTLVLGASHVVPRKKPSSDGSTLPVPTQPTLP
ncbi:hypothetical protein [Streptomyces sp. NBC_01304]|uniref:hypothetical protein n=1 Tax=Streptomyces sp. NBC_01304 TaxID=2903818 RepID=UPI002E0F7EBF|nr:hypothetical protein OG430_08930 [Streptomyces sp. NBC_01304]